MLKILGVMTGTSCDGLDAACISIDKGGWTPLWATSSSYPKNLRERVLQAQRPGTKLTALDWLELNRDLGDWYGSVLSGMVKKSGKNRPDVIANHGQTVAHFPKNKNLGCTLQLGDPTRIGHATGLTVVSNFREGDMAAGGQGAPLAPGFHLLLAAGLDPKRAGCAIHNIGGISNFTYVGSEIFAFDTGPGNIWIDAATELATGGKLKFDREGRLARTGTVDVKAVTSVLKHPYFRKPPPKSTGRDDFPFEYLKAKTRARGVDLIATATAVTVESIALAYDCSIIRPGLPLNAIYISGGGAKNLALMDGLKNFLDPIQVLPLSATGQDPQWVEAQAFAYFGLLSLLGQPLGGSWTGTAGFAPAGHILPGLNWLSVIKKLKEFE